MRIVALVLAVLATAGAAAVSGSGETPASEAAPLPSATVSYFPIADGTDPGVCMDTAPPFSVGLESGTNTLPASLVLTTAASYCESNSDCASGEECDFDTNECVEPNPCNQVCGWEKVCDWICYGNDNDPCIERKWKCWWEWDCWIDCGD